MTDIQHIKGNSHILAHLSRNIAVSDISSGIDFEAIVSVQKNDEDLRQLLQQETSSLQMKAIYIPQTKTSLWYDVSMGNIFIYSKKPRTMIFNNLHSVLYKSIKATCRLNRKITFFLASERVQKTGHATV